MDTPPKKRQVREVIDMVNFYKNMWPNYSEIVTPFINLTWGTIKMGQEQNKSLETIKKIMAKSAILKFPNFDFSFDLYIDTNKY